MSAAKWFLVGYLALIGLIHFGRCCARSTRTYTFAEGIWGLAEIATLIWVVVVLL